MEKGTAERNKETWREAVPRKWLGIKEMEEQMLDMAKLAIELGHAEILGGAQQTAVDT